MGTTDMPRREQTKKAKDDKEVLRDRSTSKVRFVLFVILEVSTDTS